MSRIEQRLSRLEGVHARHAALSPELAAVMTKLQAGVPLEALSDEELQAALDSGPDLSHIPDRDLDAMIAGDTALIRRYFPEYRGGYPWRP